jgi:hypothetical protein
MGDRGWASSHALPDYDKELLPETEPNPRDDEKVFEAILDAQESSDEKVVLEGGLLYVFRRGLILVCHILRPSAVCIQDSRTPRLTQKASEEPRY